MKRLILLLVPAIILASCGGGTPDKAAELAKMKQERNNLDLKIKTMEAGSSDTSKKATPVSTMEVQPTDFVATINIQSQITGDQNVYASPQAPGIVKAVMVHVGEHVNQGQVLATLDAAALQQQIEGQQAQLTLAKTVYEKQKNLWAQNIGTEVQLLQSKANYESAQSQQAGLIAQKNMYRVTSPISGVIDMMTLKAGDATAPGAQSIRVVNASTLKAEANLGENYLGKVKIGNPVTLLFPDLNDSIKTALTYVAQAVDPISRAFLAQVKITNNKKLHPNMSCIMKIANYENKNTLVVPVSVIQKTSKGEMLYIADGNKAKSVAIKTGANSNGLVEVLSGLNAGDKVITAGFEDLDNGDPITTQQ
jgi:membrane fusion protein (multidrug efflux system)